MNISEMFYIMQYCLAVNIILETDDSFSHHGQDFLHLPVQLSPVDDPVLEVHVELVDPAGDEDLE